MVRIYIFIAIVMLTSSLLGGAYYYYQDTQNKLKIYAENEAKFSLAIEQQEQAMAAMQEDLQKANEEIRKTNEQFAEIRRQNNRLQSKLADMDLGLIAVEKPDSIERAINRGTVNALRCFELLAGAELTEEEKNAEDGESFNKECPWLWTGPDTVSVSDE